MYQNKANETGEIKIVGLRDKVDALERIKDGTFTSILLHQPAMRNIIILNLVENNITFEEKHYGGGVYRIRIKKTGYSICKCGGQLKINNKLKIWKCSTCGFTKMI